MFRVESCTSKKDYLNQARGLHIYIEKRQGMEETFHKTSSYPIRFPVEKKQEGMIEIFTPEASRSRVIYYYVVKSP